mgnify:CR=1 FL=1
MSSEPLISIIIPSFNSVNFIQETLDSVLKTSYEPFEVILVDNASSDGSQEFLTKKYRYVPNLRIMKLKRNVFFTGACNRGANIAKGGKLVFLNSDCVVSKSWLRELVHCSLSKPKAVIQPKILRFNDKKIVDNIGGKYSIFGLGKGIGNGVKGEAFKTNLKLDYANGTCFLIDSFLFRKIGRFDEWFKFHYEDVDLCLRAKKIGISSYLCHKSEIFHKVSLTFKSNISQEMLILNIRKNRLMVIHKNFNGVEKIIRYLLILIQYGGLVLLDLLHSDKERSFVTLKAIRVFISRIL